MAGCAGWWGEATPIADVPRVWMIALTSFGAPAGDQSCRTAASDSRGTSAAHHRRIVRVVRSGGLEASLSSLFLVVETAGFARDWSREREQHIYAAKQRRDRIRFMN
jgi:uncharacterized protein (DUF1800 family)